MDRRQFLATSILSGLPQVGSAEGLHLHPVTKEFKEAAQLFNSDLSLCPAVIVPCHTEGQVVSAIRFAREKRLPVTVKSGGHSFTGFSSNDGGVMVDLSGLSQKVYLPETMKLHAGPGATLGSLYDVLLPHGRLLPAGSCSGVGLGGLCLGGGYGMFARQYGLTCDHLLRVRMVDGRGNVIDSRDDPELLWACRGGGNGNFGIVTSMEFQTRPAPSRLGAQRLFAKTSTPARAVEMMAAWFEMAELLPDPIFSAFVLNGTQVTVLLVSTFPTSGPSFRKAVARLTKVGFRTKGETNAPIANTLRRYYGRPGPLPFYNCSAGYYQRLNDLGEAAVLIAERVAAQPGLIFQVNTLGGAITRGPDSAYPHRSWPFLGELQSYWDDPSRRDGLVASVKELRLALEGAGVTAHYRNYPDLTLSHWERAYYGDTYPHLQKLKARYDPDDLIRHPQSVRRG